MVAFEEPGTDESEVRDKLPINVFITFVSYMSIKFSAISDDFLFAPCEMDVRGFATFGLPFGLTLAAVVLVLTVTFGVAFIGASFAGDACCGDAFDASTGSESGFDMDLNKSVAFKLALERRVDGLNSPLLLLLFDRAAGEKSGGVGEGGVCKVAALAKLGRELTAALSGEVLCMGEKSGIGESVGPPGDNTGV